MCQQLQEARAKTEHMWQNTDIAEDMAREWEKEEITW